MTLAIDREVHRIFRMALELDPDERTEVVRAACGDRREILSRVEALLAAVEPAEGFLETPALSRIASIDGLAPMPELHLVGARVGSYRIIGEIAAGGMGVVYLAEQENPRRTVALKIMRAGLASRESRRRFELEAHVLGRLQHPNIARIFEAATHREGPVAAPLPYFAMEYVEGAQPITTFARQRALGMDERILLFRKACSGVHHGHQKGVIHRDLKPANIIVDHGGEPRIIDYGVALVTAGDVAGSLAHADAGQVVGTLKYMSPEQCRGDATRVDTRSDVYALGVVLYELLCDRFPYDLEHVAPLEIPRVITDLAPVRPSLAKPDLPRDLETIVLRAMAKDPDDRYQSAADLERDLARFQRNEPIEARPATMLYQARLFARRHRALIGASAFAAVAALVALVVSISFGVNAAREAKRRTIAEQRALERLDQAIYRQYLADMAAAESALRANEYERLRTHLVRAPEEHRGWEWSYLNQRAESSRAVMSHPVMIDAVEFSADGATIYAAGRDGTIRAWSVEDGSSAGEIETEARSAYDLVRSPDGSALAVPTTSGWIELYDLATGERRWRTAERHEGTARTARFNPTGTMLVTVGHDGAVCGWSVAGGDRVWRTAIGDVVRALAHHPTLPIVAVEAIDGRIALLDSDTGALLGGLDGHPGESVFALLFSADGRTLYSGSSDKTIAAWDLASRERVATFTGHERSIWNLALSTDGERLASASMDHTVRLWSPDGTPLAVLHGHNDSVADVALSPDGRRVASGSWDQTVRLWDATESDRTILRDGLGAVTDVAISRDGRLIASVHRDGAVVLRDAITRDILCLFTRDGAKPHAIDLDPLSARVGIGWSDGVIEVRDTRTGRLEWSTRGPHHAVGALAFSPDGDRLLSVSRGRTVVERDADTGEVITELRGSAHNLSAMAISPDGRLVATATWARGEPIEVWDRDRGTIVHQLVGHTNAVRSLVFTPDSARLLSGSRDQTIRVWNMATGEEEHMLAGHGQFVTALAFFPEGDRFVTTSWFNTITVWDAVTYEPLVTLRGHDRSALCVAVDPAGEVIATGSDDHTLRLWDRRPRDRRLAAASAHERLLESARGVVDDRLARDTPEAVARELEVDDAMPEELKRAAFNRLLERTANGG